MIPISDNPPPGVVDRRDGNTKGDCGITSISCLFCKDQIAGSKTYVANYEGIAWGSKNQCQMATCPYWGKGTECWQYGTGSQENPKESCPTYKHWKTTGKWPGTST
jgi:hypothetical protein